MKFFNLDLHASVITDVASHFRALGHEVDSHNMSGHYWAFGLERASRGTGTTPNGKIGYGSLTIDSWARLFRDYKNPSDDWTAQLDEVDVWAKQHPELFNFDGFVVTYPPAFAMLYDLFGKPIVLDIPVRYEQHFTERPNAWRAFNQMLQRKQAAGLLHTVANNLYDKTYYEYFTGIPCKYISSTCDYIDKHAPKWADAYRGSTKLLAFGDYAGCRAAHEVVLDVLHVRDALPGNYRYDEIVRAKGFVWLPYTTSLMSFFEHYWLGVPLFVPTQRFMLQLWEQGQVLSGATCHASMLAGSNLPRAGTDMPDPHTREGIEAWMPLYDFYNVDEFPFLLYFDSWENLQQLINITPESVLRAISASMVKHNQGRLVRNLASWNAVLKSI